MEKIVTHIPKINSITLGKSDSACKILGTWNIITNCISERINKHISLFNQNLTNDYEKKENKFNFKIHITEKDQNKQEIYPFGITSPFDPLYILFTPEGLKIDAKTVVSKIKWKNKWDIEKYNASDEYQIIISKFIQITSRTERGLFYGLITLQSLLKSSKNNLKYQTISDYPMLSLRAIHIDLKKQCPNINFLKILTEILASYKINSFIIEWEDKFPFTGDLSKIKNSACFTKKEVNEWMEQMYLYYIEAIPLIQSLGHFEYVLNIKEFKNLSELYDVKCKNPREERLKYYMMCPSNEKAKELIIKIHKEIIQGMGIHKKSRLVHIGLDETYFLGYCPTCKQKIKNEKSGKSKIFIEHLNWITHFYVNQNKRPIVWNDMLVRHPELIENIDRRVIINEWNYEHPLPIRGKPLSQRVAAIDRTGNSTDWVHTWEPMDLNEILKKNPKTSKVFLEKYWKISGEEYPLSTFPYTKFFQDKGFGVLAGPAVQFGISTPMITNYTQNLPNIIHFNAFASRNKSFGSFLTNWVVRDSLWPTLIYGFLVHAETTWTGNLIEAPAFSVRFWFNFFNIEENKENLKIIHEIDNLFENIGYLSYDYETIYNELSDIGFRTLNRLDKDKIRRDLTSILPYLEGKLRKIKSQVKKNSQYFDSIHVSLQYQIYLLELINYVPKIEKLAMDFDGDELNKIPDSDELELLAEGIISVKYRFDEIKEKIVKNHQWYLQKEELLDAKNIRISPIEEHINLVYTNFIPFKESLNNFVDNVIKGIFKKMNK